MATIQSYIKNNKKFYKFQIYIGTDPLTGKRIKTTRSGFGTKKEANLALSRLQLEIERGDFGKKKTDTYQDMYDLWIEQYKNTVEESTYVKTKGIFNNHILPAMSEYKVDKINVQVCQKHVNEWFNKLKKFRTVKAYASKVLDYAITLSVIKNNPMKLVTMPVNIEHPKEEDTEVNFYTREELKLFLECLEKESNSKAYTLFRLLAYSGMRKGEALALTWNDINFKENEIRINKALSRGLDNRLYIKTTKRKSSIRTIKMDKKSMDILNEWNKKQKQDYLTLGYNTLKPKQLVFSNERNELLQPTKTRKWMLHVQKKYNLKQISTHKLRHTHCSLLFEAGASLKEVQDRLGHSDVKTTMDIYTHVTKKAKDEAIQKFAKYMDF